ncbi:MAG: gamma carbonic anhydrase family protein [Turneriella sp.]|nr:gamma carbonic anhydrase family protein [Turneriella sp.]
MIYSLGDKKPLLGSGVFIAGNAQVMGDVAIGENSSVWYGCVVRGDVHSIRIGRDTNIQDLSMVHVTGGKFATAIGDRVTIGHRVLVHGATLMDDAFVGMGATILDGATVEPFGFVAAGALVPPGFVVKGGWLALGSPARLVREIKPEEREMMIRTWKNYITNAALHRDQLREVT